MSVELRFMKRCEECTNDCELRGEVKHDLREFIDHIHMLSQTRHVREPDLDIAVSCADFDRRGKGRV